MTKTQEIIYWLRQCSHEGPGHCAGCPYNKDPYEAGCGKLLSDAALLLEAQIAPAYTVSLEVAK